MEEDARIAAGESDTSDSHGVEPLADIIKNLKAQLAHAQANAAALREFVKDFAAIKPKDTDLSYFAYLWEQFLPRAQAILTSPSPGAAMVEELEQLRKAPLAAVNTDDVNWAITELHKKLEQRYDTLAAAAREALLVWHSVSLEAEHCAFDRLKAALEGGGTDGDADRLNKRDLEVNAERNRLTTKSKSVQE